MTNKVFFAYGTELLSDMEIRYISSLLPDYRLKKAERYKKKIDRNNCLASYFMLLYGLSNEYNIRAIPEITYNYFQKPEFVKERFINFNISHCDNFVCCGLSDGIIGVDIQSRVDALNDIIDLSMSDNERKMINKSDSPELLFARYWSLKEAYLKCIGCGLNEKLNELDFSLFHKKRFVYDGLNFNSVYNRNNWISVCSNVEMKKIVIADIRKYIREYKRVNPKFCVNAK